MTIDISLDPSVHMLAAEHFPDHSTHILAVAHAALATCPLAPESVECAIVLTGDARMRSLNHTWRGKNIPTNVLSFPQVDWSEPLLPLPILPLGDVVVSLPTVAREAVEAGKTPQDHLNHMIVHGILHLLGHDHETEEEAQAMESLEREILSQMTIFSR